jgi:hypothetical protein
MKPFLCPYIITLMSFASEKNEALSTNKFFDILLSYFLDKTVFKRVEGTYKSGFTASVTN